MSHHRILFGAATAVALMATPALADRDPTQEERAAIEAVLVQQGFTTWDDIEMDDSEAHWEIDEALGADGRDYDLHLAPESFEIMQQEED